MINWDTVLHDNMIFMLFVLNSFIDSDGYLIWQVIINQNYTVPVTWRQTTNLCNTNKA